MQLLQVQVAKQFKSIIICAKLAPSPPPQVDYLWRRLVKYSTSLASSVGRALRLSAAGFVSHRRRTASSRSFARLGARAFVARLAQAKVEHAKPRLERALIDPFLQFQAISSSAAQANSDSVSAGCACERPTQRVDALVDGAAAARPNKRQQTGEPLASGSNSVTAQSFGCPSGAFFSFKLALRLSLPSSRKALREGDWKNRPSLQIEIQLLASRAERTRNVAKRCPVSVVVVVVGSCPLARLASWLAGWLGELAESWLAGEQESPSPLKHWRAASK